MKSAVAGIQYLRGLAALMVVLHHTFSYHFHWTPSSIGARGVDIFFVISGFIMAHSTQGFDPARDRFGQAGDFLLKRIIRVVPLYWIALLWSYRSATEPTSTLALDFAFLPRWNAAENFVAPNFVPGWTINYEMLFYALFAAAMLVGRWRFVALATVLVGLAALGALQPTSPAGMFLTSSMLLEFLYGIGLYHLSRPAGLPRPALVAIALACLAAMWPSPALPPGLYFGPLAAVIVWTCVQASDGVRWALPKAIGDASYSIYLFHIASFRIVAWLLGKLGELPMPAIIALHLAVATAAGLVIYRLLERPLLELLGRRRRGHGPPVTH